MSENKLENCILPMGLTFDLYSGDEIRQMSVVQVITPLSMNAAGQALSGGLYDSLMGPHDKFGRCGTCQKTLTLCSGHFGHIELPLPVVNPLFNKTVLQILRMSCVSCFSLVMPASVKYLAIAQLRLLSYNLISEAQEAEYLLADFAADADPNAKKKRKTNSAPDIQYTKRKFEEFVDKHLDGKELPVVENSRLLESFKQAVNKKVLKHATMSHTCQFCGVQTKRMAQFESKFIYALGGTATKSKRKQSKKSADPTQQVVEDEAGIDGEDDDVAPVQKYLTPLESRDQLRNVWLKEAELLQHIFPVLATTKSEYPTDVFFIDVLPVTPPKNRPSQFVNNMYVENPVNLALRHVVQSCSMIQYIIKAIKFGMTVLSPEILRALKGVNGETFEDKLETCWNDLQMDVDHVMDRDKSRINLANSSMMIGLKQIIEKKEGIFRMNMMGKRVNHAARTVITPDPNINIDEIGIPEIFAKVLTYPAKVTHANVYQLRQLVLNGPNIYPGAVAVKDERGKIILISPKDKSQREGLANSLLVSDNLTESSFTGVKTVYRHLQNGDLLLLNRQPSLHRPSIMGHRARVLLKEKVFRLHYANCKHYNADFDGDEMNAHFPQDEEARAEAAALVNVTNHFLVPKDGTPLGGLIQDHIVGAVKMTIRGRFFTCQDYHQLVFFALSSYHREIETEPPTILKPVVLWSGKQIISTIIKNLVTKEKTPLSFTSSAKIKHNEWRQWESRKWQIGGQLTEDDMSESTVIFRHGELLTGVLDKVHLGATPYGLCHAFYELYGHVAVGALLSAFSRLLTSFLQWEGFTLGVKDVLVMPDADDIRSHFMEKASSVGLKAAAKGVGLSHNSSEEQIQEKLAAIHRSQDVKARAFVDQSYKKVLDEFNNKINGTCVPYGLISIFPENNLQLLVQSGAKGSTVNTTQMSCLLGQIELEGKRPPLTVAGKSLPSFKPYELSPRAGGFILGRFLTGIRPQEFFFHCMAGREGLIDTAVKTSRSGYLQRCLVKLLEGLVTQYDMTVRDSDGCIVQFLYGEDGLDVCRSQYLKSKQMKFLEQNSNCFSNKSGDDEHFNDNKSNVKVQLEKDKVKAWRDRLAKRRDKKRVTGFIKFCKQKSKTLGHMQGYFEESGRPKKAIYLEHLWRQLTDEEKSSYRGGTHCPDPVNSEVLPSTMGVISENLQKMMEDYSSDKSFHDIVYRKAIEALSSPGDAVGVLAAQSIGEPSTQMTLNTFHFAGRGEMNVTLGIPRLREILMVASENIKTPSMDIPFHAHVTKEQCEALRVELTRVTMKDVIENIEVTEILESAGSRLYQLKFCFLPYSEYEDMFYVKPHTILKYFEVSFIRSRLLPAMRKALKIRKNARVIYSERDKPQKEGAADGNGSEGEDDDGEKKSGGKKKQMTEDELCQLYTEAEKTGQGEEHVSSDEEEDPEDADVTQVRKKSRQVDQEYEEPEEGEQLPVEEDDLDNMDEMKPKTKALDMDNDDEELDGEEMKNQKDEFFVSKNNFERRKSSALAVDPMVQAYDFDKKNQEWCQITLKTPPSVDKINMGLLLKQVAVKSIVHQVPDISKAFVMESGGKVNLKTEGINILAMYKYQHLLNLNKLHCNNIHTMARYFGIEAALKVLIKEMTDVFKVYAIVIDPRHLSLIADYMTNSGVYKPFNRHGITSSTSPLHQMSFETVVGFLRDATLSGKTDDLQNPSSRIILGQSIKVGAELFGCEAPLSGLPPGSKRANKLQEKVKSSSKAPVYRAYAPLSAFKAKKLEKEVPAF